MSKVFVIGGLAESLVNFRGDLLRALVARGYEVVAAAPTAPEWVSNQLTQWGIRFVEIPLSRTGTNFAQDWRLLLFLRALFLRERPVAVLGYTIKPVIYGSLAARLAGVPRIAALITGLGYTFMPPSSGKAAVVQYVARALYGLALKGCKVVYFQNGDDEAEFKRRGLIPAASLVVRLNGSGVNLDRYKVAPWPDDKIVRFLFIGRLLKDKGIGEFLFAARNLKLACAAAECDVIGPFDENPSALSAGEMQAALDDGSVRYHGAVRDVRPHLARCHVLVLPSYREGTPRSVLEALSTGRPVLTTDSPGCRDTVIGTQSGWLVPPRDPHALYEAMLALAAKGPRGLEPHGQAAREQARTKYDVHSVNDLLINTLLPHVPQEAH